LDSSIGAFDDPTRGNEFGDGMYDEQKQILPWSEGAAISGYWNADFLSTIIADREKH